MTDPTALTADDLSRAIHSRQISCREVMQSYLGRIHRLNPSLNAIINLAPDEELLRLADDCDKELARGNSRGWLHGLPMAVKDTADAAGFPTTQGFSLLKDAVAKNDGLMVSRIRRSGCIVIGKTNVPEFAIGSHTFNELFGPTPNAWDPKVSSGGSSGGAAVALAHRLLPVADGSDFMGSLRNPAAWNLVFGLRPSQGRVPQWPVDDIWVNQLATEGPMARTVRDLSHLLAIQAGSDPRAPLSISTPLEPMTDLGTAPPELTGVRVAWLGDLDHYLAMEDGIMTVCEQALGRFDRSGAVIEATSLTFDHEKLWSAWLAWRKALVGNKVAKYMSLPDAKNHIKPEALWEHEQSLSLGFSDFMRASQTRTAFYAHLLQLFERFDVLALPASQVWPFEISKRWPEKIGNRLMDTYHRWMEVTLHATFAGLPAISVPAGFHPNGRWPAGLQLIGKPQGESQLLKIAAAYETQIADLMSRQP